jgi:hypothetical protein
VTHEERLALIHRPYFLTTFSTPYPWGGCNIGGGSGADEDYVIVAGKRVWLRAPQNTDRELDLAKRLMGDFLDDEGATS